MKTFFLYLMVVLYVFAGVIHLILPEGYMDIMPAWLGWHFQFVIISGICEILFALLLIPIKSRPYAAWCIILLLLAVFPANVQMMLNYKAQNNPYLWVAVARLPLQLVLIYWAYTYTKTPVGVAVA
ncbi:DoxX family protein [Arcticibacter eurypsychrophilus]|uniref:DoxX family protein n=1 Tax=Arcticibacter eurypsychrophilus TaxID=1434752 RepID=UPI00084DBA43|nr:DoxX family protein [Arcticibacter eurypsychrophilus]